VRKMRVMRHLSLSLWLLLLLFPSGVAAEDAPLLLELLELLERLEQALGADADTLHRLESLRAVADCTGPRGAFTTEVVSARPLRVDFWQRAPRGEAHYRLDRLGPKLWQEQGQRWLGGPEAPAGMAAFIRGHEFHLTLFELTSRFRNFEAGGMESVNGIDCRRIRMESLTGLPASVCLAADTHRPLELRFVPGLGEEPIRIVYRDWKEIEGLWFFQGFTLTQGEDVFTYRYTALEPTLTPADADPAAVQDWTVGEWRGVRRDGGERTPEAEAAMTLRVELLFADPVEGNGQVRRLEIGSYRGFASQLYEPALHRWVRQYANDVHRRFVRLEGEVYGSRSVWQRPPQEGQEGDRRSILESEHFPDGRWLRTMYRSEDGGERWRVLWQDELWRVP
jgi:hypothetical protein